MAPRRYLALIIWGVLFGCAAPVVAPSPSGAAASPVIQPEPAPEVEPALAPDLELFVRGVEELAESGTTEALERLRSEYPDSRHFLSVAALLSRQRELIKTQAELASVQKKCLASEIERAALAAAVERLEDALKKLTEIAIEAEKIAK